MIPTLSFWITLIGRLAVEAGLLVALAAAAQAWIATPWRRRALWQTALMGIALAWSAELGGWRQQLVRHWPESRPRTQVVVRDLVEPMPIFESAPVVMAPSPSMSLPPPAPVVVPRAVWWPLQLWVAGALLLGLRALSVRVWLLLAALRRTQVDDWRVLERVEALRERVGLRRVRVVLWPGLRSPIAFGLWMPTIALPTDFTARFDDEAQEAILAHELAHLAARDPLWLGVADAVLALAWWHPAVWWSRHQLRAACESAADDASALVPGGRVRLAELLVVLGRDLVSPGWTRALGVAGDGFKSQLARRVTTLLKATHDWRADRSARLGWTRMVVLGVTALLVAIPWPGTSGPALTALIQEARASAAASEQKPKVDPSHLRLVLQTVKATMAPGVSISSQPTNAIGYQYYNLLPDAGSAAGTVDSAGSLVYTVQMARDSPNLIPGVPGFAVQPMPAPSPSAWPGESWVNGQLDKIILPEVEILPGTVSSALEKLSRLSTKADPNGHGLNLLLVFDDERPPVSTALLPERIQLRQVTLREAVLAVARASTIPVGLVMDERFAYLERTRPGKVLGQTLIRVRQIPVHAPAFSEYLLGRNFPGATNVASAFVGFCRSEGVTNQLWYPPGFNNPPTTMFVEVFEFVQIVGTPPEIERLITALDRLHLPPPTVRGREAVNAKLDQIIVPSFAIGDRNLETLAADLVTESRKFDPDHRGVCILSMVGGFIPERRNEAEIYRTEGNLTLRQALQKVVGSFSAASGGDLAFELSDAGVFLAVRNAPSPGKTKINARLDQIILPKFDLEPMPVTEAILDLVAAASRFDPEKRGVDIRLLNNAEFVVDPATGIGVAANPSLRTGISLRDTTVRAALNSIVEASSQPLVWRVDEYAVVVSPALRLYTRNFRLNPDKFVKVLQPFLKAGSTNLQDGVRALFSTNGINLGEVNWASTPQADQSAIFFQPRSGVLFVRASLDELNKIEKILQRHEWGTSPGGVTPAASNAATSALGPQVESRASGTLEKNVVPEDLLGRIQKVDARLRDLRTHYKDTHPKVQEVIAERMALVGGASSGATNRFVKMEVKLVEVREPNSSRLGLDWVFGPAQTNHVAPLGGSSLAAEDSRNENYHVDRFGTVSEVATVSSNQFAALLKRLEAEPGTELVSAPTVLTDNGRQSVVSVTQEVSVVDGVNAVPGSSTNQAEIRYNTTKTQFGPSVEMLPVFVGDSLRMHILAKITEFLGYDQPKPGQSVQTKDSKGKTLEGIQPFPHLRVRVAVADPVLRRGETAVLRGPLVTETVLVKDKVPVLGDVPLLGRLFRSESINTFKKRLYVFVTPTEMDAAGNPK